MMLPPHYPDIKPGIQAAALAGYSGKCVCWRSV